MAPSAANSSQPGKLREGDAYGFEFGCNDMGQSQQFLRIQ